MNRLADRLRAVLRARPWPFHPVLFAAYFVLFLYSVNLDEVELGDLLPVLVVVGRRQGLLLLLAGLLVGDARRAALVLTAAVVAFLAYGHAAQLLAPTGIGPTVHVAGWLAIILLAVVVAWRGRGLLAPITRVLNVASLALVLVPLVAIVPYDFGRFTTGEAPTPTLSAVSVAPSADTPDIYWFIFDRYPSERSAKLAYGIDNPIFDELRARGFYIADRSHANYQRTSASLLATFSAEFLSGRGHADIFGPTDRSSAFSRVKNSNIARFLKSLGYYYVHVGSDFSGTRTSVLADVNRSLDSQSDFGQAFVDSTMLPRVLFRLGLRGPKSARRYAWTSWELNLLAEPAALPEPEVRLRPRPVAAHPLHLRRRWTVRER